MELYIKKIELIEESLKRLREINSEISNLKQYKSSWRAKDIVERNLHKIIEAIIDIAKILISRKKLKEPSTNREVFEILHENNLFPSDFLKIIDKMIGLRNIIVHSYDKIDDNIIYGILKKNLKDIEKIKNHFLSIIKNNN